MMLLMIMLHYCAVHRLIFSQDSTCKPLVAAGSEFGAVLSCPGASYVFPGRAWIAREP